MSAIFGIVSKNGKPVEPSSINAMLAAIAHRATDGKNFYTSGNIALGHCLLKVYPQQEYEHCPLSAYGCTITADARLDNRTELATLLGIDRAMLNKTSDPELILHSYKRWGEECPNHLEGEFAFAIWDTDNQKLFAATDHIGFRPFFYYDSPEQFIFCSEIKGVVAAKPAPNYFNEESLIEYFYRKGTPNITYNKEIFALCGGNVLTLREDKTTYHKYWNLESTGKYSFKKDEEWYECTRELLYRAIEKRLNPDMPVGITLSGGLDSSSVACILSKLLMKKNKPLYAFSSVLPVDYNGIEKDERPYIEIVGKHCPNIIQTYVEAPGVGPLTDVGEAFDIEESFPNSFFFMDKAIAEAAAEKNIRNLFNGFGGDYWISNKGNYVIYLLFKQGQYKLAYRLIKQFSRRQKSSLFYEFRRHYLSHTKVYQQLKSVVKNRHNEIDWQKKTFLRHDFITKYSERLNIINTEQSVSEKMKQILDNGRIGRTVSMLYNRNGKFAMDSSTLLFDKDLMEFLYDVPEFLFVENGIPRNLLRSSLRQDIPLPIFFRTDKLPYSPGFPNRVLQEKPFYKKISETQDSLISNRFVDYEAIMNYFDDIKPFEGFGQSNKIIHLRVTHAGVVYYSVRKLSQLGYII